MIGEILSVGTELLLGDILNTNAHYLSRELAAIGVEVYHQTVVGDNPGRLKEAFALAFGRSDMVIATGGLGPTDDDLTKEMAAACLGRGLVLHPPTQQRIDDFFLTQSAYQPANNQKQAQIIQGSEALENLWGTAPGCWLETDGKILVLLPGPPREMCPLFQAQVLPRLKAKTNQVFLSKILRICGMGESAVAEQLKPLMDKQTNPTIAPYAKTGEVHMRITAKAPTCAQAQDLLAPVVRAIYTQLGPNIYGEDHTTLEEVVAQLLLKQGHTVACAESCSGGALTARLVNCPGISEVLVESVVCYSNGSKIKRLGVDPQTLAQHGAVSAETAAEMAEGICNTSGATVGIALTGIAGPSGGTEEKPVGLVYLGLCMNGKTTVSRHQFSGNRENVRVRSVTTALNQLWRKLKQSEAPIS